MHVTNEMLFGTVLVPTIFFSLACLELWFVLKWWTTAFLQSPATTESDVELSLLLWCDVTLEENSTVEPMIYNLYQPTWAQSEQL